MSDQAVFIGDVQGCSDEFDALLARVQAELGPRWELWLVGDLVNRGPGNLRLLRRARDLVESGRARYVLGNHELALLATALGLRPLRETDSFRDVLEASDLSFWVEWLRRRPLLESGRLGRRAFAMVHAAVHPDWDLATLEKRAARAHDRLAAPELEEAEALLSADRQRDADRDLIDRLTSCRSVGPRDAWSKDEPAATGLEAWHRPWTARGHEYGVVYGHWSMQGLHVAPRLRGLDTGCVHHGRGRPGFLTAWLPDERAADPFAVPDERFWQVPARRVYRPAGGGAW